MKIKSKMPIGICIYCICLGFGLLTTLASVLNILYTTPQFFLFYALFIVFPVMELYGICFRKYKLVLAGFVGVIVAHAVEYLLGGIMYGTDRLFSTFGTQMIGYIVSAFIWGGYLICSKKVTNYFGVSQAVNRKEKIKVPTCEENRIENEQPEDSKRSLVKLEENSKAQKETGQKDIEDLQLYTSKIGISIPTVYGKRNKMIIFEMLLVALIIVLGGLNVYQYSARDVQRKKIDSLNQMVSSLEEKNSGLVQNVAEEKREKAKLQKQYDELKESDNELFMSYLILTRDAKYIIDDGTKYYHNFNCQLVQSMTEDYWVHNKEYCEFLGYKQCPYCS